MAAASFLETVLAKDLERAGLTNFVREHRFGAAAAGGPGKGLRDRLHALDLKDWRFDFSDPDLMIAAEVEGGTHVYGRHNRPSGFNNDCDKYNKATLLGWDVYRFTGQQVKSGYAVRLIEQAVKGKRDQRAPLAV